MWVSFLALGLLLRTIAIALLLASAILLLRATLNGTLRATLAFSVLQPARRARLTGSLVLIVVCLALTGTMTGLMDAGALSEPTAQVFGGLAFLAAASTTFSLAWSGLASGPSAPEARVVVDEAEGYVASVGVLDRIAESPPRERRRPPP